MAVADDVRPAKFSAAITFPNLVVVENTMAPNHHGQWIKNSVAISRDDQLLAPIVEHETPGIVRRHGAAKEAVQTKQARAQSPDARLVQTRDAPRRFDARKAVQTLAEHQLAARPPLK